MYIYIYIRHRAYRHSMACCFLFSLFLQELPPEFLPMSENLTEEREIHLSPAGVRQRSLKMWLCSMTIPLCSMRWPHSQPLFTTFHADFRHRAYRHNMACCFLFGLSLQELTPELLPMSGNRTEERDEDLSPGER